MVRNSKGGICWVECELCAVKLPFPLPASGQREYPGLCMRHWQERSGRQNDGEEALRCAREGCTEPVPLPIPGRANGLCSTHRRDVQRDGLALQSALLDLIPRHSTS